MNIVFNSWLPGPMLGSFCTHIQVSEFLVKFLSLHLSFHSVRITAFEDRTLLNHIVRLSLILPSLSRLAAVLMVAAFFQCCSNWQSVHVPQLYFCSSYSEPLLDQGYSWLPTVASPWKTHHFFDGSFNPVHICYFQLNIFKCATFSTVNPD